MPESYQPHFITPIGGPRYHRGTNSDPSPLSPQRKIRSPNLKYEALEISGVGGPFERVMSLLTHYIFSEPFQSHSMPPIGGNAVTGPENSVPSPLRSPMKASIPQFGI